MHSIVLRNTSTNPMGIPASDAHRVSPPQLPDPPHLVVSSHSVCTNIVLNCVMGIVVSGICAQRVHVDSAVKSLGTSEVLSALQRICVVDGSPSFSIQAKDLFGGDRLALQAVTLFSMQVSPEVGDGDANFHQINDDSATQHENGKRHINYTPVKSVSHAVAAALSVLAEQQVIAFSFNSNIVDTFKIIPNKKQPQPIPSVALLVVSFGDMSMFGVETHSYGPFHCRYNMPLKSLVGSSNSLGDETDLVSCNNPRDSIKQDFDDMVECFDSQIAEDDSLGDDRMESYITRILDAKYEQLDIDEFIATQTHLDEVQRNELNRVFSRSTRSSCQIRHGHHL
ncbi:hypothetical protein ACHAWO_010548 [Cyclotella atomus]|uniref:Uncharacterized protein n=1 Tax=Cyclotella atomus TaxID=382360 RepID=A0ABD3QY34_9STRA